MYKTVLLPIDGSKHSTRAEQTAMDLAEQYDAELRVLHIIDTRRYSEPALSTMELVTDEAEDQARAMMDQIAEEANSRGIATQTDCRHGIPHKKIKQYATDIDADIIVMGSRGHTHKEKMGSVANRVVRDAPQQTLTV